MFRKIALISFSVGTLALMLSGGLLIAQSNDDDLIVAQLNHKTTYKKSDGYQPHFEMKRVKITPDFDDPLMNLDEYADAEDALEESGCFLPCMKLIYKDFTYVVSTYCATASKFKNSAPYTPSGVSIPNDLVFTESVVEELENAQKKHLKTDIKATNNYFAAMYPKSVANPTNDDDTDFDLDHHDDDDDGMGDFNFDDDSDEDDIDFGDDDDNF